MALQPHFASSVWWQLWTVVTWSDSVDLTVAARWLLITVAWTVKLSFLAPWADWTVETTVTWSLAAWTVLPIIVTRVWATSTTATVVALY